MADRLTIQDRMLAALRDALSAQFKEFYDGDPYLIPESSFPCIIVETQSDTTELGMTGHDAQTEQIVVKVVLNLKSDFESSGVEQTTHKKLRQLVGARDETTGEFLPQTVKGVLRKNFTLTNATEDYKRPLIENRMTVSYGIAPRPQDSISNEAHIVVSTKENVPVSARS